MRLLKKSVERFPKRVLRRDNSLGKDLLKYLDST
jgi:hypothetical protein